MTAHDIRQEARQLLKNLIGKGKLFLFPILANLLPGFLRVKASWENQVYHYGEESSLPTSISHSTGISADIFNQLLSFITTVLLMSAAYTLLEAYRKKRTEASYEDSFRAFNSPYLFRLFLLYLVHILLLLPWFLLMFAPLFGLAIYAILGSTSGGMAIDGSGALLIVPVIIGFVMLVIKLYAYSQANYILYDRIQEGGNLNPFDITKESVQLMKGKKFDFFILHLSFIGWFILIPFTLGLLSFYVTPYIWAANTIFYDKLRETTASVPTPEDHIMP